MCPKCWGQSERFWQDGLRKYYRCLVCGHVWTREPRNKAWKKEDA